MKRKFVAILSLLLVLSCVSISEVSAHRLLIDHEIGEIGIKAYFEGGSPCRDANVKVYDNEGNLYLEGVTDDKGKFGFPPKIGMEEYTVAVDAVHAPGHKAETVINLSHVAAGAGGTDKKKKGGEKKEYEHEKNGWNCCSGNSNAVGHNERFASHGARCIHSGGKNRQKYG